MTTEPTALRGSVVGAASGAISVAAHGVGGGAMPSESALVALLAVCAAFGGAAARIPTAGGRLRALPLVGLLAAGQAIGHTTLSVTIGHAHGLTLPMLAAHIAAIGVTSVLLAGVERAWHAALSLVARIVAILVAGVTVDPVRVIAPAYRPRLVRRLNFPALDTRGPPLLAHS